MCAKKAGWLIITWKYRKEVVSIGGTLRSQLINAIKRQSTFGRDKHSDKKMGKAGRHNTAGRVYSYTSSRNREATAKDFAQYMKENYPNIKNAYQLTSEHCQEWLNSKAISGKCSTDTLKTYRQNLNDLEKNINSTYSKACVNLHETKTPSGYNTSKVRCQAMSQVHQEAVKATYQPYSTGYNAITIAQASGCRCAEIAKMQNRDITINKDGTQAIVHAIGKGGRERDIIITNQQDVQNLQDIKAHVSAETSRFCPCKSESLQVNIQRHIEKAGLKDKYSKSTFHAIRKNFAQRQYNQCRTAGMTKQESLDFTSNQIGHGCDRDATTMTAYVANQW
ncbi:MAG: hypothetical protein PHC41_04390 [Lachnospiraceae bacterium]|nr:hypothetical protein [Lachnospiraceae bacterium]MDD3615446.1 hypothetical protein [Lachnospiraceae bacterium]